MNHTAFLMFLRSAYFKYDLKIKQRTYPCEILVYAFKILLCHGILP